MRPLSCALVWVRSSCVLLGSRRGLLDANHHCDERSAARQSHEFQGAVNKAKKLNDTELGTHEFPDGYFADDSAASKRCPGPTGSECAANRHGDLCGSCKDGYFKVGDDGCKACDGEASAGGTILLVVVLVFLVLFPWLGHQLLNADAMERQGMLMTTMALGIFLTSSQVANVIIKLSLEWPAWLQDFFNILRCYILSGSLTLVS